MAIIFIDKERQERTIMPGEVIPLQGGDNLLTIEKPELNNCDINLRAMHRSTNEHRNIGIKQALKNGPEILFRNPRDFNRLFFTVIPKDKDSSHTWDLRFSLGHFNN